MDYKIAFVSLGCDKNRVDTENMLFTLATLGNEITNNYSDADVIIINTCAFIESARVEAIDTILEMAEYKNIGNLNKKVIVTGCLVQKYVDEIMDDLKEVDAFLGIKDYDKIGDVIDRLFKSNTRICVKDSLDKLNNEHRILTTPYHYAYLRIADGCNNKCTYCTIPSIRGAYQSREFESLVSEAKGLVNNGAKEIILVAQDVTKYGIDLYGEYRLLDLIRELTKLDLYKLRLMYCYPEQITEELIAEIANNDKVASYIDIPFQHTSDKILKLMHRKCNSQMLVDIMKMVNNQKNHIAVRTTFMVGFPGETEEDFNHMCEFIKEFKPEHIGVFAYSIEEDTPSAKLPSHLSQDIKSERVDIIGQLHLQNCIELGEAMIGKTIKVIYEDIDYDRDMFVGRSEYNSPDIDTNVYFTGEFADVGQVYDVLITGYDNYDLIGEIKNELTE